jgi:hypothetical protein
MSPCTQNHLIRHYWYINGQPPCPTMSLQPCAPRSPSQKLEVAAWQRSQTSDIPLGAFRLARAGKSILRAFFRQQAASIAPYLLHASVMTVKYTDNNSWLLVHAVRSLKFPHSRGSRGIATRKLCVLARPPPQVIALLSGCGTEISLAPGCLLNARGSGSKLIRVPSSHFHDLLTSFGDASGDGAADRRVRSNSEAAAGISGRDSDRLILRKAYLNS